MEHLNDFETIIQGLQILGKYAKDYTVGTGYERFYAGDSDPKDMAEVDLQNLDDMGWYWDDILESWYTYV